MADIVYLVARTLHFLSMALWIGLGIYAGLDTRTSFAAGPANFPALRARQRRIGPIIGASGFLTIGTGLVMIFARGGFAHVARSIHVGLLTAMIAGVVGGVGVARTWTQIDKKMEAGEDVAAIEPLIKRIGVQGKVFQALWLFTLLVMVFRFFG